MKKKIIEEMLFNYKINKTKIKNMLLECEEYDFIQAVTYQEKVQTSGGFKSSVEDAVMRLDEKKKMLLADIKKKESEIQKIDNAIEALNERERILIEKYYIEGIPIKIIAINLGLDQTYVSALKGKILKKLSNLIIF